MTTFEQHHAALSRVQPDAPHPDSYRPDLPLRSELIDPANDAIEAARDEGHDAGYREGLFYGKEEGRDLQAARVRELETENATLREKLEKIA